MNQSFVSPGHSLDNFGRSKIYIIDHNSVDEGLDAAALTSASLMCLGRRNATTGGSGNNLASVSLFSVIIGKKLKKKLRIIISIVCFLNI
jgi:hypothetical protein